MAASAEEPQDYSAAACTFLDQLVVEDGKLWGVLRKNSLRPA